MTGAHGQASAELAALLALAVILGASAALIAGPPLAGAVRTARAAVLARESSPPSEPHVSAADIADVQAALAPGADALSPDAALLALERRHASDDADAVADAVLLDAARASAPWLGAPRAYRAWTQLGGGPYEPLPAPGGDHDVETPTGPPVVTWIGIAAQRTAVADALAHHTSPTAIGLEVISMIPGARLARTAAAAGADRVVQAVLEHAPEAVHAVNTGSGVVELVEGEGGDVPAGLRAGDVTVEWPVHRSAWRDGRRYDVPAVAVGRGIDLLPPAQDYEHVVYLRPSAGGLAIVAERWVR
jgi:hypothetical protein